MARKRNRLKTKQIKFSLRLDYERPASFFEGKTAEKLVEEGFAEIDRMGYRVVQRQVLKPTTTMAITLWLGKNFPTYHIVDQAATIWHELVHGEQWRDPAAVFPLRYPLRRWQWAFETQAYRQQCRVIRALLGDDAAKKFAYWVPGRLQEKPYTMRRLDAADVRKHTLRAIESGLPGLNLL